MKLILILLIFTGCATVPRTDEAHKIDAIVATGIFESADGDDAKMARVKRAANEVAELGRRGMSREAAHRAAAEAEAAKNANLAAVGKFAWALIIIAAVFLLIRSVSWVVAKFRPG